MYLSNPTPTLLPQTLAWGSFKANDNQMPTLIFSNTLRLNFTGLTPNTAYNWTIKVQKGLPNASALDSNNFTTGAGETTKSLNIYLMAGVYNVGNTYFFGLAQAVAGGEEGIQFDFKIDNRITLDTGGSTITGQLLNQAFSYSGQSFNVLTNRFLDESSLEKTNITVFTNAKIPTNLAVQTYVTSAISGKENTANKGVANGYASLDSDGKVPNSQIPLLAIKNVFPVSSQAQMLALTAQVGDMAIRSDLNKAFILKEEPASTLANWLEILTPVDQVLSVNGQTGAVSLSTANVSENTNLYFTVARVRSTDLTGLPLVSNVAIATNDTVLQAFAKLQGQINSINTKYSTISSDLRAKMRFGETVKVLCYGDSTTLGNGVGDNYPERLQAVLRDYYNNNNITVVNQGVNQRRATAGASNVSAEVVGQDPDLVIIMFGINDIISSLGVRTPIATFKDSLKTILDTCITNNIEPILLTPLPISSLIVESENATARSLNLIPYVEAIRELQQWYNLPKTDLFEELTVNYNLKDLIARKFATDGLHPVGFYKLFGEIIFDIVFNELPANEGNDIYTITSPYIQTNLALASQDTATDFWRYVTLDKTIPGSLKLRFFNKKANKQLFLLSLKRATGGNIQINREGVLVRTVPTYSPHTNNYDVPIYITDLEPGYYSIDIKTTDADTTGISYPTAFAVKQTIQNLNIISGGATPPEILQNVVNGRPPKLRNTATQTQTIILSEHRGLYLDSTRTLIIEAEGLFPNEGGFTWFGKKSSIAGNLSTNLGYVFNFQSSTALRLGSFTSTTSFDVLVSAVVGTINFAIPHIVRIEMSPNGNIKGFLNGVLVLNYTHISGEIAHREGYIGYYGNNINSIVALSRLQYGYL